MNLLNSIQNSIPITTNNTISNVVTLLYDSGSTDQYAVESITIDNIGNVYATSQNANQLIKITPELNISLITVNLGVSSPNDKHRRIYIDSSNRLLTNNTVNVYIVPNIQNPTTAIYLRGTNFTQNFIYPPLDLLYYTSGSLFKATINPSNYSLGTPTTFITGLNSPNTIFQMALQPSTTNLYLTDKHNNLVKRYISSSQTVEIVPITVSLPIGLCFDNNGYLYVSEQTTGKIWKYNLTNNTQTLIATIATPKQMIVNKNNILFITSLSRYIYTMDLSQIS
jgi:hypothetical protein